MTSLIGRRFTTIFTGGRRTVLGRMSMTSCGLGCADGIWVDGGYGGQLLTWVSDRFKFCLEVVLRPKECRKFILLPRRWVVERTFAWLNLNRRLSKNYERLTRTDEAWVYIAMNRIMAQRLA